jgi:ABC-type multidrug transport system fused ATPase/permease subunit
MRATYLKAVLRQDVGYFDLHVTSTSEVITSVSNDSLVIQDVISEKVLDQILNTFQKSHLNHIICVISCSFTAIILNDFSFE